MTAETSGARTFGSGAEAYDRFMGRYSRRLAEPFAEFGRIEPGVRVLDVGCGPGAFTEVAVRRAGAEAVSAVDPTPGFVEACRARHPGVDVRQGAAEQLPFDDDSVDRAVAQLVMHFVGDPAAAVAEQARVVSSGGTVAACVWDFAEGMQMLRAFWDAATRLDPEAPDEARTLRFGGPGELAGLFVAGDLEQVEETTIAVESDYRDFDELWAGFAAGVGPAGAYCVALGDQQRAHLRTALFDRVGRPSAGFTLRAVARCARAVVP